MKRKPTLAGLLLCTVILLGIGAGMAETASVNPLLDPSAVIAQTVTPADTLNILLLGVDFGHRGYWDSDTKKQLEACHADAMLVVAIHPEAHTVDLISFPSETLAYVPGVKGVYRLNAAINCGEDMLSGLTVACNAVSWAMGGIRIDQCCAIDMNAMEAIGDAIGGVDFEMDMNYRGFSGARYRKGLLHLSGIGIVDYLRACGNATVAADDLGRTVRQRAMMMALFDKLTAEPALLMKAVEACVGNEGFFTNIPFGGALMQAVLPLVLNPKALTIGSYGMTGECKTALGGWQFLFTDQGNRQSILQTVYGFDAPPLAYVDYEYTKWLKASGFAAVHALSVADAVQTYLTGLDASAFTAKQQTAAQTFRADRAALAEAFQRAAETTDKQATEDMQTARKALQRSAAKAAKLLHDPEKLTWSVSRRWMRDPFINEVSLNWD